MVSTYSKMSLVKINASISILMEKPLLIIFFTISFSSVAEVRCGGDLWNIQEVVTPHDSYQLIITKHACTKGGEYINGQFYEDGKISKPYPGMEGYSYSGQIIDSNNNIVVDFIGGGDELSVVDTPVGFPLFNYSEFFLWCI